MRVDEHWSMCQGLGVFCSQCLLSAPHFLAAGPPPPGIQASLPSLMLSTTALLHLGISIFCCPGGSVVMNMPVMQEMWGSIPELGRSPRGGHSNPLQYSCLGNPVDRGAWRATVYGVQQRFRHNWSKLAYTHVLCPRESYIHSITNLKTS